MDILTSEAIGERITSSSNNVNILVYILIVILLLVGLIWVYFRFDFKVDEYELIRQQKVNETIQWLYQAINDVCYHCNMAPIYDIVETSQITYTDKITNPHNIKGTIYLVIWNDKYGRIFSHNTLIYAMLHEITHILSPSIHHEAPFDSIETILMNTALNLGYYNPNIPMESNYMTLDLGIDNDHLSNKVNTYHNPLHFTFQQDFTKYHPFPPYRNH